jgi:hypothetical protein
MVHRRIPLNYFRLKKNQCVQNIYCVLMVSSKDHVKLFSFEEESVCVKYLSH